MSLNTNLCLLKPILNQSGTRHFNNCISNLTSYLNSNIRVVNIIGLNIDSEKKSNIPFWEESEIERFPKSKRGRFNGLSLISNPRMTWKNHEWKWEKQKGSYEKKKKKKKKGGLQKASSGDWKGFRLTLTTTGLGGGGGGGRAEELSAMFVGLESACPN